MRDFLGGQMVKFNIWKVKRDVFSNTDPQVVAYRNELFPDGEPSTDEFVKRLALHIKRQMQQEENKEQDD